MKLTRLVERDAALAKFWLAPVRLQHSLGFGRSELVKPESLMAEHRDALMRRGMIISKTEIAIPIEGLLLGKRSGESQGSFERWLATRRG